LSPYDRVLAFIDNPAQLSAAQREAVVHPGGFFLSACPGSGKTRTIGVRVAWASVDGNDRTMVASQRPGEFVRT
jgi:hypothetical protein